MERTLDHDLTQIRQRLLEMGAKVETMISESVKSLLNRDVELAADVVRKDREVDDLEKQIDEQCLSALALRQPTAIDLRYLVSVMNIVNNLERTGDSAKNIARSALELAKEPPPALRLELERLSRPVREMVRQSLDAFVHKDAELAREIWQRDDEIDRQYEALSKSLLSDVAQRSGQVGSAFHQLLVAQNLERIADHATNICESVIFYIEASDIRHSATTYDENVGQ